MGFKIAFLADTHLGYAAKVRIHSKSGLNERVRDGYLALRETVDQILEHDVDLVLHGGDLFHRDWPAVSDIAWANMQLGRLVDAGIPVIVNTGNHDASGERGRSPATAAIEGRGITVVRKPLHTLHPADGLSVHVMSHYGLARSERMIPEAVQGEVNIFTAHGAAQIPGHDLWKCLDSPGEQMIGVDLLTNTDWAVTLLGHYHEQSQLPDIGRSTHGQAWYAGSALRRGFSDRPGKRGWLLVDVDTEKNVTIERKAIAQRPQFDLAVVDAADLTGDEVYEAIMENLQRVDPTEAIIRQVVMNVTAGHRAGMNMKGLTDAAGSALQWLLVPQRPELTVDDKAAVAAAAQDNPDDTTTTTGDGDQVNASSLVTARGVNLTSAYRQYVPVWGSANSLPEATIDAIITDGEKYIAQSAPDVDDTLTNMSTPSDDDTTSPDVDTTSPDTSTSADAADDADADENTTAGTADDEAVPPFPVTTD